MAALRVFDFKFRVDRIVIDGGARLACVGGCRSRIPVSARARPARAAGSAGWNTIANGPSGAFAAAYLGDDAVAEIFASARGKNSSLIQICTEALRSSASA